MTTLLEAPVRPGRVGDLSALPQPDGYDGSGARVPRRPRGAALLARCPGWLPDLAVALALGVLVAVTHAATGAGPAPGDDEGTYTAQAYAVSHFGTLAHYTYWYDHPPLGWLLLAGWDSTIGRLLHPATAVEGGRQAMVGVAVATGALLFVLGRRLGLRRWSAATAVVAWAMSPLALSYSRMVYLDDIGVALVLGALVLACSPRRHLWAFAGAGLLLAGAVLTKETLVLSAPAVALAVWGRSAGRTRAFCVAAFATTALAVVALYPLFALLKGEFFPGAGHVSLLEALRFQIVDRPSSGSPLSPSSPAAGLVGRWLNTDPWLLGASVLLTPLALAVPRLRVLAVAVAVPALVALRPGYLPDPYVVALLAPGALLVAGLLDAATRWAGVQVGGRLAGLPPRARGRLTDAPRLLAPRVVADGGGQHRRLALAPRLLPPLVATLTAATVLGVAVAAVGPRWGSTTWALGADPGLRQLVQTEDWIAGHVPHDARVVVDDTYWVDLVQRGFDPHRGVVWFYKTDFTNNLDPSVAQTLPNGYRDLDYVVLTPVMRAALDQLPGGLQQLRLAVGSSEVVAAIGTGIDRTEVRKVVHSPAVPAPSAPAPAVPAPAVPAPAAGTP